LITLKFDIFFEDFIWCLFERLLTSHLRSKILEEQIAVPGFACASHTIVTHRLGRRVRPVCNADWLDKFRNGFLSLLFNAYDLQTDHGLKEKFHDGLQVFRELI